jgi:O-antigen/teichoic acid export membrane protein
VLSWALALGFVTSPADNVIFSAERVRAFLPFFWLKVVVHVGLDLLLIPRWSYMGASVATLVSEVLDFVTHICFIRLILGHAPSFRAMGRGLLLPGVGMVGVMVALSGQPVLVSLAGGMVAYGAMLLPSWRRPVLLGGELGGGER